jgi:16S rRNA (cytosine1402-N4)-methyltransferase
MTETEAHKPVMAKEVFAYLQPKKNGIYLDCTVGSGGHLRLLLENFPAIKIIAFDQDSEAISRCQQNPFFTNQNITFINDNFVNFPNYLTELNISQVDGFLFDLGVSSEQLADSERGFSYRQDSPLDMRMNTHNKLTAAEIINNYKREELVKIFANYGEERHAKKIAWRICQLREKNAITTTQELVKIVASCQIKKFKKHPARRVFQALRIVVNHELDNLFETLIKLPQYLKKDGKIIVISYHSLEDRIVKQLFKKHHENGFLRVVKKPLRPSLAEIGENYRARSAKMRILARHD